MDQWSQKDKGLDEVCKRKLADYSSRTLSSVFNGIWQFLSWTKLFSMIQCDESKSLLHAAEPFTGSSIYLRAP